MAEDFLTPVEVADLLKIKKNTVYEMIKRGDLRASKLGKQLRIRKEDLDAYLNNGASTESPATTPMAPIVFPNSKDAPLPPASSDGSSIIICGQDTILDKLCDHMSEEIPGIICLRSKKGSYNALYSLYNRQVNIATCHLWDPETDTYNLPYISKMLPGMQVKVFHILKRKQGFYLPKGNPKNIRGFEDLTRSDIHFINREPGCGTRILLDGKLKSLGIDPRKVNGYYSEKFSHLGCATDVAVKMADVGLGNERTSKQLPDIEFLPLQTESYDMVIPTELLEHPSYQTLIEILRSESFRKEVEALGGYDVSEMGRELL